MGTSVRSSPSIVVRELRGTPPTQNGSRSERQGFERAKFAFDIYDFEGKSRMDMFYLGDCLRGLNLNPTLKMIDKLGKNQDARRREGETGEGAGGAEAGIWLHNQPGGQLHEGEDHRERARPHQGGEGEEEAGEEGEGVAEEGRERCRTILINNKPFLCFRKK